MGQREHMSATMYNGFGKGDLDAHNCFGRSHIGIRTDIATGTNLLKFTKLPNLLMSGLSPGDPLLSFLFSASHLLLPFVIKRSLPFPIIRINIGVSLF